MRAMVGAALEHVLEHIRELPSQPVADMSLGAAIAQSLNEPIPTTGRAFEELLAQLFGEVIPASVNTISPGFMAYIPGGGIFHAAVADFIAKSVNRYVGQWRVAPGVVQLEWIVLRWFCDMMGYGADAGGVLTSGGSIANLMAVIAARTDRLPENFLSGVIYVTEQTHHSIAKAARIAGFPARCLRTVAIDSNYRMDLQALQTAIADDRRDGRIPFLVIGTAGTTNTGAIDPLGAIADIAEHEQLWFHIDGAYGAYFILTETGRQLLRGIERADSITLDPHKGLCLPYGTGALITRRLATLTEAFSIQAHYLCAESEFSDRVDFCDMSPELSREWRGLRLWLPLKMHGIEPFRDNLDEKLTLIKAAEEALRAIPHLEIVARPQLSVLAFRLRPKELGGAELDDLNQRLLDGVTRRQRVLLSSTRLDGRLVLRIALLSFRTHAERLHQGLKDIRAVAAELT